MGFERMLDAYDHQILEIDGIEYLYLFDDMELDSRKGKDTVPSRLYRVFQSAEDSQSAVVQKITDPRKLAVIDCKCREEHPDSEEPWIERELESVGLGD